MPRFNVSLLLTVHASWKKSPRLLTLTSPSVPNCAPRPVAVRAALDASVQRRPRLIPVEGDVWLLLDVGDIVADALELEAGLERVLTAGGHIERCVSCCADPRVNVPLARAIRQQAAESGGPDEVWPRFECRVGTLHELVPGFVRDAEVSGVVLQVIDLGVQEDAGRDHPVEIACRRDVVLLDARDRRTASPGCSRRPGSASGRPVRMDGSGPTPEVSPRRTSARSRCRPCSASSLCC